MKCVLYTGRIIECSKIHFDTRGRVFIKDIDGTTQKLDWEQLMDVVE